MSDQTEEVEMITGGDPNAPDQMQDLVFVELCKAKNKEGGWLFRQYIGFNPQNRQHKIIFARPAALLVTRAGHPLRIS